MKCSRNCVSCKYYNWFKAEGFLCTNKLSDKKALDKAGSFHALFCKYYMGMIESEDNEVR